MPKKILLLFITLSLFTSLSSQKRQADNLVTSLETKNPEEYKKIIEKNKVGSAMARTVVANKPVNKPSVKEETKKEIEKPEAPVVEKIEEVKAVATTPKNSETKTPSIASSKTYEKKLDQSQELLKKLKAMNKNTSEELNQLKEQLKSK